VVNPFLEKKGTRKLLKDRGVTKGSRGGILGGKKRKCVSGTRQRKGLVPKGGGTTIPEWTENMGKRKEKKKTTEE